MHGDLSGNLSHHVIFSVQDMLDKSAFKYDLDALSENGIDLRKEMDLKIKRALSCLKEGETLVIQGPSGENRVEFLNTGKSIATFAKRPSSPLEKC